MRHQLANNQMFQECTRCLLCQLGAPQLLLFAQWCSWWL